MKQGWESKKLGEVAKIGAGNSAPQDKSLFANGVYPFFRTSDIGKIRIGGVSTAVDLLNDQGIKKLKLYPKGTILLPKSGASTFLNHRVILDVDGFVSSHLATVVCDEDLLDKRFALYYLIGIKAQDLIQNHSYPSLKLSDIKEIPIAVPPLEEQKQIVAKLDQCFEAIDKAKANAAKNLENAKELFQSKLNNIFSQKGEGWVEKEWGDTCDFVRGPFGGSLKKSMFVDKGFVVYEQKHAIHNHFNQLRYFINEDKFNEMIRFELKPGDIIMSCSGVTLGRVAVVPNNIPRGVINQALLKLTPKKDLSVHFIKHWIRSKIFQDIIFQHSGGAAIPNVPSVKILKQIKISLPSLTKQEETVNHIELLNIEVKKLESKYQQELNSLEELKKSILQKAFEGEL